MKCVGEALENFHVSSAEDNDLCSYLMSRLSVIAWIGNFSDLTEKKYASEGYLACLNIWNTAYTSETLKTFSLCKNSGDVYHLNETSGERITGNDIETLHYPTGIQSIISSHQLWFGDWLWCCF